MLPEGSLPLGCADSLDTREWTFTVPEGGRVVFYTDGLIENSRDVIAGERQLREAVRDLLCEETIDGAGAHDPALALQQRIFGGVANRDDAAILTLSRKSPVKSYVFSAVPMAPALARGIAAEKLDQLGVAGDVRFGVLVALGEAVANAVEHAYRGGEPGLIRLELAQEDTRFVLAVEDFGRWRPFVHREERGRGLAIMHALVDGVQIHSTRDSTRIVLKANLTESREDYGS
jgi:anti-sigma regulatory factor (Ser/Thr protein kinase)